MPRVGDGPGRFVDLFVGFEVEVTLVEKELATRRDDQREYFLPTSGTDRTAGLRSR